ncbi:MAG: hypothetical protein R3B84_12280 [Zavarzinella sp.]
MRGSPQFFLALSQAKQIKKLSIRFNLALLGNIKFLSSLKHLEELTIVGREPNEVVDPELFRSLSQLENLANLNITNIIGKDDQYSLFRTMTGLKKISIDNPSSSVTDKLFTTLSHCSKLQSITLTKMSSINGTMLSDLSVLPELTHMHFTNIGFSSGEVLRLTQLPKLNTVSFSGNTESNVGQYIHLINKLNPNLNIQFNELFIPR